MVVTIFLKDHNPIYRDIFAKAQVKRKKFLEQIYTIENNTDLIEKIMMSVLLDISPPHPEAYTKSISIVDDKS